MSQLTDVELEYLSDDMYLPVHYVSMKVEEPHFEGRGNHSVSQLEELCAQYKEYVHQQAIVKQNCKRHIIELKFNKKI